jgi:hypothetical protein
MMHYGFSMWHWLIMLALAFIVIWPIMKIVKRTGNGTGMGILISILTILFAPIGLWVLALIPWPVEGKR